MGDVQHIAFMVIKEELQCTICWEMSLSPIHSCVTGHIVCGLCIKKIKKCGICKQPLGPSALAERLVRKYDLRIPCGNTDFGCTLIGKSWEMTNHLSVCEYRPIKCFESQSKGCKGRIFGVKDFAGHLIKHHKTLVLGPGTGDKVFKIGSHTHLGSKTRNYATKAEAVLKFNGKYFFLHSAYQGTIYYNWITIAGGTEDARAYNYKMEISAAKKNVSESKFEWILPVLPLNGFTDLDSVIYSGNIVSIHWKILETVCVKDVEKPGKKSTFSLTIQFQSKDPMDGYPHEK